MRSIMFIIALIASSAAHAADGPWTTAPIPNVRANDAVAPADRAGRSSGSSQDAPFSGMPAGNVEVQDAPNPSAK